MDRRAFFRNASVGASATALTLVGSRSATAEQVIALPDPLQPRKTAISVLVCLTSFDPVEIELVLPEAFEPRSVFTDLPDTWIRMFDDDERTPVIEVSSGAFACGPVEFWRDVIGKLRCELETFSGMSVLPYGTLVVYGEIPR